MRRLSARPHHVVSPSVQGKSLFSSPFFSLLFLSRGHIETFDVN